MVYTKIFQRFRVIFQTLYAAILTLILSWQSQTSIKANKMSMKKLLVLYYFLTLRTLMSTTVDILCFISTCIISC